MTRWMVSNGAMNIVLVSRSASASGKVKELMNDLRATAGANILLRRCDVADKSSVDALFRSGMTDLPPVRGVVHGSMVLKVSSPFSLQVNECRLIGTFPGCPVRKDGIL